MALRQLYLSFFIFTTYSSPGGTKLEEIGYNPIFDEDESLVSRHVNGLNDNFNTTITLSIAKENFEMEMQVLTTKNVTYFFNISSSISITHSKLLMQFNSSKYGIVQDIRLVANFQDNKSKIIVPLHSLSSGKTQFYLETVMLLQNDSTAKCKSKKSDDLDYCGIKINIKNRRNELSNAIINISVYDSKNFITLSTITGWIYFFAWSLSFYPQIYQNWQRKSVIGLNFDFLALNTIGYWCYTIYNFGMFSVRIIQEEYWLKEGTMVIPVKLNDLAFSSHGIFACLITILQCLVFERGGQKISKTCWFISSGIGIYTISILLCKYLGTLLWLDCLIYFSYVKIFVTVVKYIPQAHMNYQRKSTDGWNIVLVLLDLMGGVFSSTQMIIDGYNFNDWSSLSGNSTKFGIALVTYVFDFIFILQHYVLYRNSIMKSNSRVHVGYEPIPQRNPSQLGMIG